MTVTRDRKCNINTCQPDIRPRAARVRTKRFRRSMGCGCSKAAVGVSTEHAAAGAPPAQQAQQNTTPVPAALKDRAARDGMWFIVHRDKLDWVEREEVCEMATEFWSHHPHGDTPGLDEFVAIKLSKAMIERQQPLIHLSSYGIAPYLTIPHSITRC